MSDGICEGGVVLCGYCCSGLVVKDYFLKLGNALFVFVIVPDAAGNEFFSKGSPFVVRGLRVFGGELKDDVCKLLAPTRV